MRRALSRSQTLRYSLAVGLVAIAVIGRLLVAPLLGGGVPYLLFVVSTIVTANLAGRAPALLAAVLGGVAADYFFMPPLQEGFWHVAIWTVVYLLVSTMLVSVFSSEQQLRVRAEAALREVERNAEVLRTQALLIDSSHDAIIIADPQRRITAWNEGAAAIYGWTFAEARGNRIHALLESGSGVSAAAIDQVLAREGRWEGELVHLTKCSRRLTVDSRQVLLRHEGNRPVGILEIDRDITERKQAEEELRRTNEIHRLAMESANMGTLLMDVVSGQVTWDERARTLFGLEAGAAAAPLENLDVIHPGDRARVRAAIQRALDPTSSGSYDTEFRVTWPDSSMHWLISKGLAWFEGQGATRRAVRLIGTIQDITARKQIEQSLRESEERLRLAQQAARIGTFEWNIQTGATRWTPELEAMHGLPRNGFAGTWEAWEDLIHPEDRPETLRRLREAMKQGAFEGEWRVIWPDGTSHWLAGRAWVFRDEFGMPLRLIGVNIDISEGKKAEAALRESELRERARAAELEAVLDAVPAVTFVARDSECRHIIGSRATYNLLRMPLGSNLSRTPADGERPAPFRIMKDGEEIPIHELPMRTAASTGQAIRNYEFDFVFDDGSCRTLLGDAIPMLDQSGRTQGVVAAFLDITEHKRSEENLRHAQKLESIGLLAGGIAHDFNNLLASIMGNAGLLQGEVGDESHEEVEAILKACDRAADLTRQLLAYAGRGRFIVQAVNLSTTVRELTELLYASIPKKVYLEQLLDPDLPPVEADPGQIQQIAMNLVLNAAEAIPENHSGTVTIRTSVEEVTAQRAITDLVSRAPLDAGRYVCLEVSDTGAGMDEQIQARMFDPFFTTKFTGRGLGLAAVGGVVKAHRGAIQVTSSPGNGSTFRVFLPAAVKRIGGAAVAGSEDLRGSGTVLVVDDEEMLRNFVAAALGQLGYTVLTAGDGQDAIDVFERHSGQIDLILLDLTMPVMTGEECWEALRGRYPAVRVILMTGHSESEAGGLLAGKPFSSFLQKPFSPRRLARQVRAALLQ